MLETSIQAFNEFENYGIDQFDQKFQFVAYSKVPATVKNTAEHFKHVAKQQGYDGIKGDVQISKDGVVVMCHDPGFTLNEEGKITKFDPHNYLPIINMTYSEVTKLTHATQFQGKDVHPTDLDTFLQIAKRYGKYPFITIRKDSMDQIAPIVVDRIRKYNQESCAIVNSFTYESLRAIRSLSPGVALSFVQPKEKPLNQEMILKALELKNALVCLFNSDCNHFDEKDENYSAVCEAMKFAKEKRVRVWNAVVTPSETKVQNMIVCGLSGMQTTATLDD